MELVECCGGSDRVSPTPGTGAIAGFFQRLVYLDCVVVARRGPRPEPVDVVHRLAISLQALKEVGFLRDCELLVNKARDVRESEFDRGCEPARRSRTSPNVSAQIS